MACALTLSYDENLMENRFFQALQREYKEIFLKAIYEGCVICVPRSGSLLQSVLTLQDFLLHILAPTEELPETHFRNLCGTEVKINSRLINIDREDGHQNSIRILFQETFYTKEGLRYEVLCVEQPFREANQLHCKNGVIVLRNLRDCLDLLRTETETNDTLENIDRELTEFLKKNETIDSCTLQVIKNLVSDLCAKCSQILFKNASVKEKCKLQKQNMNNLKIAVEAYVQHGIYKKIMKAISTCTASDDANLNKIVRNFSDLHFKDFKIKSEYHSNIPKARLELSRINEYSTTLGKVGCLTSTILALTDSHKNKFALNADDLLQLIAFLIIKTNLPNWNAQLKFLKIFQFSDSFNIDENNYLITSLEAALTYVQSGIFSHSKKEEKEFKTKQKKELKHSEIQLLKQISDKSSTKEKTLHQFFHHIALGKLYKVKEIIEVPSLVAKDISLLNLCHPLCTCEKCLLLIHKNICDAAPTVKSCDDQGLTALHVASMYGMPNLVEYFLACKADPNAVDCDGRTPVHYAALRGHQNALLLLIHSDADINVLDNYSNTPLQLCANNGHENCVKALIYFSEYLGIKLKVNQQDSRGDTPLHNAAKWGYVGIVEILLEYGADPTILNKRQFSPIDYSHNVKIFELFKQNCHNISNYIKIKTLNPIFDLCDQINGKHDNQIFKGVQPSSMKHIKKVEKILHAVENGDINLVSFFLGIDASEFKKGSEPVVYPETENKSKGKKCHPLCICPKCGKIDNQIKQQLNGKNRLKKKSLSINICNSEGYTGLHVAAKCGQLELVRGFIHNGAFLDAQTSELLTPLMLACQNQNLKIAKDLLDSGCNIDLQDSKLNTALHYACYTGNTKLVEILLKHEPNISYRNLENKTVLNIAKDNVFLGILQILKGGKSFDLKEL